MIYNWLHIPSRCREIISTLLHFVFIPTQFIQWHCTKKWNKFDLNITQTQHVTLLLLFVLLFSIKGVSLKTMLYRRHTCLIGITNLTSKGHKRPLTILTTRIFVVPLQQRYLSINININTQLQGKFLYNINYCNTVCKFVTKHYNCCIAA